jgi:tryptophan synthase beta chain
MNSPPPPPMSQPCQFLLRAEEMPTHWYNLLADFPEPLPPPLHPGTQGAGDAGPDDGDVPREPRGRR